MSPNRHKAIISSNAGMLLIESLGPEQISVKYSSKFRIFMQENALETVVWKMVAILSRPQYINALWPVTINPFV